METAQKAAELPLHPQDEVECRRCEVHCDKIVYPASCLEQGCPFLYAYEGWGSTWIGCMQKVFDVELDLDLVLEAEREGGFGAVRSMKRALPLCRVEVDACYSGREDELGCVNPEFHELPEERPSFRVFSQVSS
jgi:hypothetical protein